MRRKGEEGSREGSKGNIRRRGEGEVQSDVIAIPRKHTRESVVRWCWTSIR